MDVKDGDVVPILANSELTVGSNRVAVGIIGPDSKPMVDAKVHFAFYNLNGGKETRTQEMDAVSRVPARDAGLPAQETIRLPDGTTRNIFNVGEEVGHLHRYRQLRRGRRLGRRNQGRGGQAGQD